MEETRDARVIQVLEVVRSCGRISAVELAKRVGLSSSRLEHLIKEQTGISLRTHRLYSRMHKAAELLLTTNLRVSEIAYAVGFGAASNFAHEFRRHFKVSATTFRRQQSAVNTSFSWRESPNNSRNDQ
jgi:AraC family transcriptional regulator of arabinose operon